MKICAHCRIEKDESEFGKDASRKDGLRIMCRECRKKEWKKPQIKEGETDEMINKIGNIFPSRKQSQSPLQQDKKKTWPLIGEFVLVNFKNDPWYGYKVKVLNVKKNLIDCEYRGQIRTLNITSLSHFRDGYNIDFTYAK
jgi:hypothetical protein